MDATPPRGRLVVVATPLGNLGDVSARALDVLASADALYCEDTRRTRQLLSARHIDAAGRLESLHEHNEAQRVAEVVARVARGETVALVSDAGTPLVSDPGARVVTAVAEAGLVVTTVPGPSAVVAALSVSGLAGERFCFEGFFPRRAAEQRVAYRAAHAPGFEAG
ncbi:MAG TPA: rRNA small subunit methyltransferase 1, partial [Acidimicrobiales bacterium]|nr:rRNA small subunit methyltransferase 1 [Acidimicrobiales bacterium]